ncbi:F/Y rich C-terminus-domain-containing protein [Umbelopsis sp. PMI_123]|nr:F/Y rich C-terminus-domain-containing protein [Umbelopsis sp. PMI_123]
MTQPTLPSVASKRHGDIPLDGDQAALDTVTTSSYSEENYRKLKRRLKEIILQNESIAYSLDNAKKKIQRLRREKSMLLDTISRYSEFASSSPEASDSYSDHSMSDIEDVPHVPVNKPLITPLTAVVRGASHALETTLATPSTSRPVPSSAKPKRMRKGPVAVKVRRIQPLERDPITNDYKLPARIGILTVHALGHIVWQYDTYHNDRYIWPVGFCVSRTYLSMSNRDVNTNYVCSILDGGETGPKYHVVADDAPNDPIIANSATGAWTVIVRRANEIREREHSNSASGPDYYGLTHPTIAKMIQDLPNADKCRNYVWQEFEVMQERTAAGVAAAAQKKLENLVKMGSANKKPPGSAPGRTRKSKYAKGGLRVQAHSPEDFSRQNEGSQTPLEESKMDSVDMLESSLHPNHSPTDYAPIKVADLQVPDNHAAAN